MEGARAGRCVADGAEGFLHHRARGAAGQRRTAGTGTPQELFHNAQHPYTRALVNAMPRIEPGRARARRALMAEGVARTMV